MRCPQVSADFETQGTFKQVGLSHTTLCRQKGQPLEQMERCRWSKMEFHARKAMCLNTSCVQAWNKGYATCAPNPLS